MAVMAGTSWSVLNALPLVNVPEVNVSAASDDIFSVEVPAVNVALLEAKVNSVEEAVEVLRVTVDVWARNVPKLSISRVPVVKLFEPTASSLPTPLTVPEPSIVVSPVTLIAPAMVTVKVFPLPVLSVGLMVKLLLIVVVPVPIV